MTSSRFGRSAEELSNRPRTRRPAFAQRYGGQAVLVLESWSGGVVECWKFLHSKQEVTGPLSAS